MLPLSCSGSSCVAILSEDHFLNFKKKLSENFVQYLLKLPIS